MPAPRFVARLGDLSLVAGYAATASDDASTGQIEDLPTGSLQNQVNVVIATLINIKPAELPFNKDGDINIRSGSAMVFVKVRDDPPLIDVFSPVLTEVGASEALFTRLSELMHRMPIGRIYYTSGTVWASIPVIGRDFQPSHLTLAVRVMTGLADELDDRLQSEFGGKRFFAEDTKQTTRTKASRILRR
jgi:hypothetical protein